jgi:hypothetical protein
MGWHLILAGWTGNAVVAGLALGCAGADGTDQIRVEPPVQQPGPVAVITEIQPSQLVNRRPRFISIAPQLAREGVPYRYGISVTDPDGEEVHFKLLRAPEGAALQGGVLQWTPEHRQAGRPQQFTLRAVDERGAAEDQTWTIIPKAEPHAWTPGEERGHH